MMVPDRKVFQNRIARVSLSLPENNIALPRPPLVLYKLLKLQFPDPNGRLVEGLFVPDEILGNRH